MSGGVTDGVDKESGEGSEGWEKRSPLSLSLSVLADLFVNPHVPAFRDRVSGGETDGVDKESGEGSEEWGKTSSLSVLFVIPLRPPPQRNPPSRAPSPAVTGV